MTKYTKSGDAYIGYQVVGDGPIDVVFMPDWITHLDLLWELPLFARPMERMASLGRLILFDMRGSGTSDPAPSGVLPTEEWMADVKAVMDAAGSRRASLIGMGHAGQMAMLFVATYPTLVDKLVLFNSYARLARADDYPIGQPKSIQDFTLKNIEEAWGTPIRAPLLGPSVVSAPGLLDWWAKYERLALSPGAALARQRLIFELDVRDVVPLIQVPTLVIHRKGNPVFRVDHARYLHEHIPGSTLVELDGSDHWPIGDDLIDEFGSFIAGHRPEPDAERVLATVLFTDIVDSTRRAAEAGDQEWRRLLDQHDASAARTVAEHRGRVVKSTGDGLLATFDGPARAVRCSQALNGVAQALNLSIRAGVHTGEIELRRDDIGGIAVHIAARVSAKADAGEVLVSRTVKDLVAGSGIRFEDRGLHELKGVPEEWQLFAAIE